MKLKYVREMTDSIKEEEAILATFLDFELE
jgi:hypothetical protein